MAQRFHSLGKKAEISGWSLEAARLGSRALSKLQRPEFFRKLFQRYGKSIVLNPALAAEVEVYSSDEFFRNLFSRAIRAA